MKRIRDQVAASMRRGLLWVGAATAGAVALLLLLSLSPWGPGINRITLHALKSLTERITTVRAPLPILVTQLQSLNRLECARQTNRDIIEAESESPLLPGFLSRDRVEMIVQTEVIAGVDLSRLKPEDIRVAEGILTLRLPPPRILTVRIEDRASHVYHRERGWLVFKPDPHLEREARLKAEQHARQAAQATGLLETARRNAEDNLRSLLQPAGYQEIRFEWQDRLPGAKG